MLPRPQFDAICGEHGVQASPAVVLEYLHRSGRVFYRDGLFDDHIILDQSWALRGVYAILERKDAMPQIRGQAGWFSPQLLAAVAWRDYSEAECAHFLQLMLQCQICFKVAQDVYVAPDLLPSRDSLEAKVRAEWRGAIADAVVRLEYEFLHEGVLRATLCELGERAGDRALYWAYGLCFYDPKREAIVTLASKLPDEKTGDGGWIRIEAGGRSASACVTHLVESILRVSIGRAPAVTWERGEPAQRLETEHMTEPFADVTVGHPPQAATEPQRVYVSYAWEDASSAWVDQLEQCMPPSLQLIRDKNAMRPGQWISEFMREIGRARLVVVVLSGKYLRSRYCMRELLHLHDQSLGERAHLMQRVVPLVVGDLQVSDAVDRLEHAAFWKSATTNWQP